MSGYCLLHAGSMFGLSFFDPEEDTTCSFETSVDFQRTTWCFFTEVTALNFAGMLERFIMKFGMKDVSYTAL
jgi:hypothetical protein